MSKPRLPLLSPRSEAIAVSATGAELVTLACNSLGADASRRTLRDGLARCARIHLGLAPRDPCDPSDIQWHALTIDDLAEMRRRLIDSKLFHPSTIRASLAAVRNVLRAAKRRRLIDQQHYDDVSDLFRRVPGERPLAGRALSDDEVARLLEACKADRHPRGAMLRAVLLIALGTGIRRAEICRLGVDCFDGRAIRVVAKGDKVVACFLTPATRRALDEWLDVREGLGWSHRRLFGSPVRGGTLKPWELWALFVGRRGDGGLCKLAGVRRFGIHDMRRSFATKMFAGGLGTGVVQKLMHHANQETTTRYDRRGDAELDKERLKVADYGEVTP